MEKELVDKLREYAEVKYGFELGNIYHAIEGDDVVSLVIQGEHSQVGIIYSKATGLVSETFIDTTTIDDILAIWKNL